MHPILLFLSVTTFCLVTSAQAADEPVKVFLLAGQSNMEGKAKVSLMEYQAGQPGTRESLAHLRTEEGDWKVRDDVFIKYLERKGGLTVGFGSPKCIGPELAFGNAMGDHFDQPVLLIKTAWGGKSLWRDFRPPSSGLPLTDAVSALHESQKNRNPNLTLDEVKAQFGHFYRQMISETRTTMENAGELFPVLKGRELELAGVVWFQGWNDMINPDYTAEYAANMANFIRDVRKDLSAPALPFVIGVMGVDGETANPKQQAFRAAQAAPAALDEFKGNVAVVQTSKHWDEAAYAVFKKGWKEHLEEWNKVGSDYPFHYLGSVKTMLGIGQGFAEAMLSISSSE